MARKFTAVLLGLAALRWAWFLVRWAVPGLKNVELLDEVEHASDARWSALEERARDPEHKTHISSQLSAYWNRATERSSEVELLLRSWLATGDLFYNKRTDLDSDVYQAAHQDGRKLHALVDEELRKSFLLHPTDRPDRVSGSNLLRGLEYLAVVSYEAGDPAGAAGPLSAALRLGKLLQEGYEWGSGAETQISVCRLIVGDRMGRWTPQAWGLIGQAAFSGMARKGLEFECLEDTLSEYYKIYKGHRAEMSLAEASLARTRLNLLSGILLESRHRQHLTPAPQDYKHAFRFVFSDQVPEAVASINYLSYRASSVELARRLLLGIGLFGTLHSRWAQTGTIPADLEELSLKVSLEGVAWDHGSLELRIRLGPAAAAVYSWKSGGIGFPTVEKNELIFELSGIEKANKSAQQR
jgi:hypothetical protein